MLFYITQIPALLNYSSIFVNLIYQSELQKSMLNDAGVSPTSNVCIIASSHVGIKDGR
jgi:hypothetical protein